MQERWIPSSHGFQVVTADSMHAIALVKNTGDPDSQFKRAALLAAAPELRDTCEALAAFTRDLLKLVTTEQIKAARLTTRMLKLNDQAFNVLAKARGETT